MVNYIINTYGTKLIAVILCMIFGWLGVTCRKLLAQRITDKRKLEIASIVSKYAYQVWRDLDGHGRMQKALEAARALLEKQGIVFDTVEMQVMIEAAWTEFKNTLLRPEVEGVNLLKNTYDSEDTIYSESEE